MVSDVRVWHSFGKVDDPTLYVGTIIKEFVHTDRKRKAPIRLLL